MKLIFPEEITSNENVLYVYERDEGKVLYVGANVGTTLELPYEYQNVFVVVTINDTATFIKAIPEDDICVVLPSNDRSYCGEKAYDEYVSETARLYAVFFPDGS